MPLPGPNANDTWGWKLLIALDQLCNVLVWRGDPDETISSNAARNRNKWWGRWLCRVLNRIDPGHCDKVQGK